jgi:hypothetical protein
MPYNADQIEAIIAAAEGWERALVTLNSLPESDAAKRSL